MAENTKNQGLGRPSIYSHEIATEICARLSMGESLVQICRDDHMPHRDTVYSWLWDDKHKEFSDNYARARKLQAEYIFDDILAISDNCSNDKLRQKKIFDEESGSYIFVDEIDKEFVQRSKLRVDARKWYLAKMDPKKFGDQKNNDTHININFAQLIREGRKRIDPALRVFKDD